MEREEAEDQCISQQFLKKGRGQKKEREAHD